MGYQVLARKYRPRTFNELVGQEHVARALVHALDHDRLHHAYLFTGTRGVGKTTIARILSRCLNCEQGVSSSPCGTCATCEEINEGRFVDLIEVDAASRTKVEDTRELLDNVQYAPTRGRYKVYLIDEVHMLSSHSFNALLKTLEEPPPHVKFLLATTGPQKLPVTILSRCLQFNLKALPAVRIAEHLKELLEREMIRYEDGALQELGEAARGSMRDALSLTDQAIAFSGETLNESDVRSMLGTVDRDQVRALLEALGSGEAVAILDALDRIADQAPDFISLLDGLIAGLHRIAVVQIVPERADDDVIKNLASQLSAEAVQLYYDIAIRSRQDLNQVPDARMGLEMILLRMVSFRPQGLLPAGGAVSSKKPDSRTSQGAPLAGAAAVEQQTQGQAESVDDIRAMLAGNRNQGAPAESPQTATPANRGEVPVCRPQPPSSEPPAHGQPPAQAEPPASSKEPSASEEPSANGQPLANKEPADLQQPVEPGLHPESVSSPVQATPAAGAMNASSPPPVEDRPRWWAWLVSTLQLDGGARNLARQCVLAEQGQDTWKLVLRPEREKLKRPERIKELERELSENQKRPIRLEVLLQTTTELSPDDLAEQLRLQALEQARISLQQDNLVQALRSELGAILDEDSIEPLSCEQV